MRRKAINTTARYVRSIAGSFEVFIGFDCVADRGVTGLAYRLSAISAVVLFTLRITGRHHPLGCVEICLFSPPTHTRYTIRLFSPREFVYWRFVPVRKCSRTLEMAGTFLTGLVSTASARSSRRKLSSTRRRICARVTAS